MALASDPSGVLDFTSGAPRELADRTLAVARDFFVFSLVVALLLEAFGRSPTAPRDYGACLFRAAVVLVLLVWYRPIFGSVVNLTQGIAERVTPKAAWFEFAHESRQYLEKLYDQKSEADEAAAKSAVDDGQPAGDSKLSGSIVGGFIFQSFISVFVLIGQGALRVVEMLSRILCGVFFVLGPLALVFSIPRFSSLGTRWFGQFVTFASWPIFSGLMLALCLATGVKGLYATGPLGSIVAALVMVGMGFAAPILASAVIGGSLKDVASHGVGLIKERARSAAGSAEAGHRILRRRFGGSEERPRGAASAPPASSLPGGRE